MEDTNLASDGLLWDGLVPLSVLARGRDPSHGAASIGSCADEVISVDSSLADGK